MFFQFFDELRTAHIPVTLKEYLALMDALDKHVIDLKIDDFYYLSRRALVKDEKNFDKFDRVFGQVFKRLEALDASLIAQIPQESMGHYEVTYPGRSVEHWNQEAGAIWLSRVAEVYPHIVWLNPIAQKYW